MNAPKVNPEVNLPPSTHTAESSEWWPPAGPAGNMGQYPAGPFLPYSGLAGNISTPPLQAKTGNSMQSQQVDQLSKALATAQGQMRAAAYNRVNPHFKSRYADLASVWDAIREPLAKNGLSITQQSEPRDNGNYVLRTVMRHISGQWVASEYPIPTNLKPQELGSWKTYLRRYELSSLCGIASDEDDDAGIASKVEDNPINAEQIEHLQILINDDQAILDRLLTYLSKLTKQKIERLEQIPQSQFPTAFAALSKKVKAATP